MDVEALALTVFSIGNEPARTGFYSVTVFRIGNLCGPTTSDVYVTKQDLTGRAASPEKPRPVASSSLMTPRAHPASGVAPAPASPADERNH